VDPIPEPEDDAVAPRAEATYPQITRAIAVFFIVSFE